ncbi:MAG: cytosine permease [Candidatus Sungbacteria bacterium]|nr:cytosine permease [Candidatus Sungbacteria bacterium]
MSQWINRAVLLSFWLFSAWYLYIGGILTKSLNFPEALLAITIANLTFVLIFTFYAGTKKPKDLMFREAFGNGGARYCISLLPSLTQIGWYAIVVEIGGTALTLMLGLGKTNPLFYLIIFCYGLLTIWIALGGFQRMGKLSYLSIPAMLGFSLWGAYAISSRLGFGGLLNYQPVSQVSWGVLGGIQLLVASFISAAVTIPDFLHDLGSKKNVFLASFWGLVPTALLVGGLGAAFAIVGKNYDVLATLQLMSGPLFVYALLSIDNLCGAQAVYPVGTGLASIHGKDDEESREARRKFWTIAGGLISIALAMIGIVGKLEAWLVVLGTIFSPIIGIVLANQYFVEKDSSGKSVHFPAIIAWLFGCAVSFVPIGVPILQSLIASLVLFVVVSNFRNGN